jgi:hypothetical protein
MPTTMAGAPAHSQNSTPRLQAKVMHQRNTSCTSPMTFVRPSVTTVRIWFRTVVRIPMPSGMSQLTGIVGSKMTSGGSWGEDRGAASR